MTINNITVHQLQTDLESGKKVFLLDVRLGWEYQLCHLPHSCHIPLDELLDQLHKIPKDLPIVTICHHGVRSERAALLLSKSGFKQIFNLVGGINSWAKLIDQSMTVY